MKSGKRHINDGMELPNQDKIRTLGKKEPYKYLVILKGDIIKQEEIKDKIQKDYLRRTRKPLEKKTLVQKPYQIDKYLGCTLRRYLGPFIKWTRDELKQMD